MVTLKKNYPGMFDLIKGYAIITILVEHTFGAVSYARLFGDISSPSVNYLLTIKSFLSLDDALMPLFFIISGYGFSAISMKKCIKKQSRTLLKPYFLTALFVTIVFFFSQLAYSGKLWRSVIVTSRTALSYLLGLPERTVFFGIQLNLIGTIWFVLALFVSWVLLNAITLYVPERLRPLTVFACICMGYLIGRDMVIPFCLSQGLVGVGYLYAGQQIKKHDWLLKELPFPALCILFLLSAITFLVGNAGMAYSDYKLGLIDIAGTGCFAFLIARGAMLLNNYNNALTDKLRMIGRYSFWIICTHTVESQGLFWGLFSKKFGDHAWIAFITILPLRSVLIFIMCTIVSQYNQMRIKQKRYARQHSTK